MSEMEYDSKKKKCNKGKQSYQKRGHMDKEMMYWCEFVCASCNASYVGQTHRHLTTRIDEHFGKDKKSHIYQHLMSSVDCLNACSSDCFSILDTARTKHQLRIKESLFISWLKPTLNKQKSHQYIISLSI